MMTARFDENGDLWVDVCPKLANVPSWVWPMMSVEHDPPGRVEINLTAYMRSARHRNWVSHAMYPAAKATTDRNGSGS
jgi:hypothetical protein